MVLLNGDDPNCVEVARECLAPIVEVGFSANCAERIRDVSYTSAGLALSSLAKRPSTRRSWANSTCATRRWRSRRRAFTASPPEVIQAALTSFEGIAAGRKCAGSARGVTVIDDFGHHPTAIRETLRALRHRYPGQRLWAIFEPRSNTTRRAVFQQQLPEALELADGVFISQVAGLEQIPDGGAAASRGGRRGDSRPQVGWHSTKRDAAAIVERIVPLLQPNDVVIVFSNGGFDGIHARLLRQAARLIPPFARISR